MALISLSDKADYFPYPDEADRVDYAVVPADNLHTRSVSPSILIYVRTVDPSRHRGH